MPAKVEDVARLAGVSKRTVANVVNDFPHVKASTRERVQAAIVELNYRPSLAARSLKRGTSMVIELAVPELNAPYFAELGAHISDLADRLGYGLVVNQTRGLESREQAVVDGSRARFADGIIFSPLALDHAALIDLWNGTPMVLLGERVDASHEVGHVGIDNVQAAIDATTHLIEAGATRLAAIGRQEAASHRTAHLRLAGFEHAVERSTSGVDGYKVSDTGSFHQAEGYRAAAELFSGSEGRPDGIFCFNDTLALGALRALTERGIRVPHDVMLIGFDDIEDSRFSTVSLSTVSPDMPALAERAVDALIARLSNKDAEPVDEVLPHRVIARESTAR